MLDTVFYFILNMSIAACFAIGAMLIIRQIKPLPRRAVYPLWGLVFFRLVMPFAFTTKWSLFNYTGGLVKRLISVATIMNGTVAASNGTAAASNGAEAVSNGAAAITNGMPPTPDPEILAAMNFIGAADQYAPIEYKAEQIRQVFTVASAIWVVVASAMILAVVVLYILAQKELSKAIHIKGRLYRSDTILSPVLAGLFRPKIILPAALGLDSEEFRMILAHENTHKRRMDNLWRLVGIFVACLHWFNPLSWVMLWAFFSDMELSCDELAIRKYDVEGRKAYAETMLRFAEDKGVSIPAAFGRSVVKARIVNVLTYRKMGLFGAAASLLFLIAVAAILITNPQMRG